MQRLDERLGDRRFRLHVHLEAKLAHPRRRGRADGGDPRPADIARVGKQPVEPVEKRVHAVRAGEDDPVVGVRILHQFGEFAQRRRRLDADRRDFEHVGPERAQFAAERSGLFARAGDDDASPEKRTAFKPVQRVAQPHDLAEDRHRRGLETGVGGAFGDVAERADERFLARGGGPADERDGQRGVRARVDELAGDGFQPFDAHEHDPGAGGLGELGEIDGAAAFFRVFVAGKNGQLGNLPALGDGDARVGRSRYGRGHARHHLERRARPSRAPPLLRPRARTRTGRRP